MAEEDAGSAPLFIKRKPVPWFYAKGAPAKVPLLQTIPLGLFAKAGERIPLHNPKARALILRARGTLTVPLAHIPLPPAGRLAGGIFAFPRSKLKNQQKTSIQLNFFEPVRYNDIKQAL